MGPSAPTRIVEPFNEGWLYVPHDRAGDSSWDELLAVGEPVDLPHTWNATDSQAFAAPFAPDADFVNVYGMHARGRDAIAQGHEFILRGPYAGSRVAYTVEAVRLLRPDVALAHVGGTVVLLPEFKAAGSIAVMAAERVTHTLMVPAMYTLCLMSPALEGADLSRWRVGGYGGAPMPVAAIDAMARRLPGLTLVNAYGATETTSPATLMPPGLTRDHADTVGVPLPCADVRVMDEDGRELPAGATGELWIAGPMVVRGYWDNPEATAAAFTGGHWHSGDLGQVDAEGFVRLVDRKKDMLNRGGFKIYSVEV